MNHSSSVDRPECQRLFGRDQGERIQALVEEATSGPCPCMAKRECPFIPTQRQASRGEALTA